MMRICEPSRWKEASRTAEHGGQCTTRWIEVHTCGTWSWTRQAYTDTCTYGADKTFESGSAAEKLAFLFLGEECSESFFLHSLFELLPSKAVRDERIIEHG